MTRPRKEPIEITAEKTMERMKEEFGRRRMLQMLGAAGAGGLAGCGGGGGGGTATPTEAPADTATETESPTPTATEATGGMETDSPTPTPTPGETVSTPTGEKTVADVELNDVVPTDDVNFQKFQTNVWNSETGFLPGWQRLPLSWIPQPAHAQQGVKGFHKVVHPIAVKKFTLNPDAQSVTVKLRDDVTWGSGQQLTMDHVKMHHDILKAQVQLGEQGESTLPLAFNIKDDFTAEWTLLPGNFLIRAYTGLFQGGLTNITQTHPQHHRKFVESLRNATSNAERQKVFQNLFSATFKQEWLPDFTLGGFQADRWDPQEMFFKPRKDFPWGLDYHPDMEEIFSGLRWTAVGTQQASQAMNLAATNKIDWVRVSNEPQWEKRLKDAGRWELIKALETSTAVAYFNPKSYGAKTERDRKIRKAAAYYFNPHETTSILGVGTAFEKTSFLGTRDLFDSVIGIEDFKKNWTDYGSAVTQWQYKDKGAAKLKEIGASKNKNGIWVDENGEPITMNTVASPRAGWGMTRPTLNNIAEQWNRYGFKSTIKIIEGDQWENTISQFEGDWDVGFTESQAEVHPHPYFGYREDMGLGSRDGMPTGISSWDWRNGHRRVQVPVPIGNPDGQMTTVDWDKNVKEMAQITDTDKFRTRQKFLEWTLNQWVPGINVIVLTVYSSVNRDQIGFGQEMEPMHMGEVGGAFTELTLNGGFFQPPPGDLAPGEVGRIK